MGGMIDKEKLIEKLKERIRGWTGMSPFEKGIRNGLALAVMEANDMLEVKPPERPKGRWEKFMFFNTVKQCSVCGCTTDCKPNFRPNCGTDMRGEDE